MKKITLLMTLVTAAGLVAGCDKEPTAAQQLDKVQAETTQAVQEMKDYTFAEKAAFVQAMQERMTTLNHDLDKLASKIESSSDAVKAEAKPKLQALRAQAATLNTQLVEVQNATESTWDSVKAGTKKAYAAVETSFTEARQWLSDQIAP